MMSSRTYLQGSLPSQPHFSHPTQTHKYYRERSQKRAQQQQQQSTAAAVVHIDTFHHMDTPSPASSKAKSHRKQKLLRSHEIVGKRRQRAAPKLATTPSPPTGTTVYPSSPGILPVLVEVLADSSPTIHLPNAITPATSRGQKHTSGDRLTDRTHV